MAGAPPDQIWRGARRIHGLQFAVVFLLRKRFVPFEASRHFAVQSASSQIWHLAASLFQAEAPPRGKRADLWPLAISQGFFPLPSADGFGVNACQFSWFSRDCAAKLGIILC